jgi:hypothetical protein
MRQRRPDGTLLEAAAARLEERARAKLQTFAAVAPSLALGEAFARAYTYALGNALRGGVDVGSVEDGTLTVAAAAAAEAVRDDERAALEAIRDLPPPAWSHLARPDQVPILREYASRRLGALTRRGNHASEWRMPAHAALEAVGMRRPLRQQVLTALHAHARAVVAKQEK